MEVHNFLVLVQARPQMRALTAVLVVVLVIVVAGVLWSAGRNPPAGI